MPVLQPRSAVQRKRRRSLIDLELDPAQREAVRRPVGGTMLVLGEAGHGKTTVALHRLAHLHRSSPLGFRAVVIVPHVALEHMLQPLLTQLGLDVRVRTYDAWARSQAKRAFGDIPRRQSVAVAPSVLRMKRSAALMPLLREVAAHPPRPIDDDFDAPPPPTRAYAHRADLQHLFGDGERMRRLARELGLGACAVEAMLEHTHVQFLQRSEQLYSHVDAERLVTLDHHSLDAGTPPENAGSIDPEAPRPERVVRDRRAQPRNGAGCGAGAARQGRVQAGAGRGIRAATRGRRHRRRRSQGTRARLRDRARRLRRRISRKPGARRALYVAVTRARHQLVLACAGEPSPLLPAGSTADPRRGRRRPPSRGSRSAAPSASSAARPARPGRVGRGAA